jgi:nitrite reductase/ring-hydroxylating ferredoxin subunit
VPPLAAHEIAALVDIDAGTVAGRAFVDDAIYELELERVFARAWMFLCDPDELTEAGQFVSTFTGEDPVAIVRQVDGSTRAVLNSCRHRGLPVCGLAGQAPQLTCGYHGWTYDLDGRLVGVSDGDEEFRRWAEERQLALVPVTRTRTLGGLLFGSWDGSWEHDDAPARARVESALVPLRDDGPLVRQRRPIVLDANWKVVCEVLGAIAESYGGTSLFPSFGVLPEHELVTAVHPKGPQRTEVWVSTTQRASSERVDSLRVAIETGLEPEGPRTVVLNLKSRATEGCPADEVPVALPPRHVQQRSAMQLYRAWLEHMIDDRPLTGLITT